jgi:ABC-type uncharacterized transport system fused permease/ATPase subunit
VIPNHQGCESAGASAEAEAGADADAEAGAEAEEAEAGAMVVVAAEEVAEEAQKRAVDFRLESFRFSWGGVGENTPGQQQQQQQQHHHHHEATTPPSSANASTSTTSAKNEIFAPLSLAVEHGLLLAVSGSVGVGKSTLLLALLGELPRLRVRGRLRSRAGLRCSFVPQTPVVFGGSVRENILLGLPLDEARYTEVGEARLPVLE